jgi:hypothetical protein
MVKGKKPMFLVFFSATAVTSTMVSPLDTTTEPLVCFASLPVSKVMVRPPISASTFLYMQTPLPSGPCINTLFHRTLFHRRPANRVFSVMSFLSAVPTFN